MAIDASFARCPICGRAVGYKYRPERPSTTLGPADDWLYRRGGLKPPVDSNGQARRCAGARLFFSIPVFRHFGISVRHHAETLRRLRSCLPDSVSCFGAWIGAGVLTTISDIGTPRASAIFRTVSTPACFPTRTRWHVAFDTPAITLSRSYVHPFVILATSSGLGSIVTDFVFATFIIATFVSGYLKYYRSFVNQST